MKIIDFHPLNFIILFYFVQTCFGLYSNVKHVIPLTPNNFDNLVIKGDEVWIIKFYAPWCNSCQNLVPEFTKLANVLKGIIKVGVVNADDHRELAGLYNVRELPTVKIFGVDKQKPEDYTDVKSAKKIMEAALNAAKDKVVSRFDVKEQETFKKNTNPYVIELTDSNFNELVLSSQNIWIVEFYAPWCGYCRNLNPHWKKAAEKLHGKVKFGAIDGTIHRGKLAEYNIQGYPSIKLFRPGSAPIDYEGERTSTGIISWVMQKYEETLPVPKVLEIIDKHLLLKQCDGKQWIIVTFLPDLLDCKSICRKSYLRTLESLAKKFKKNNWCWLWSEANAQPEIQQILHVGGSGYPVLVAVNYETRSYTMFIGPFVEEKIYKFLVNLNVGVTIKVPIEISGFPEIINIEPWDGKDRLAAQTDEKEEL